jgi:hypothetical protein
MGMRVTLATAALTLWLAAPAWAAKKQIWDFIRSGDDVQVYYGIPESHAVTIQFICNTNPKELVIASSVTPRKPRKGQAVRMTLSNGTATAGYDGKILHDDEEGFHFQAVMAPESKVVAVLKSGKTLTIGVPSQTVRVPLRGVAKPLAQFEAACFGGR